MQARGADGSFPPGAAFEASQLEPGGQTGIRRGQRSAVHVVGPAGPRLRWPRSWEAMPPPQKLKTFMGSLNATRDVPEDWSGNEPDEWAPWEFDFFGAPDQTQRFVRAIADSEYADAPVDEPGNDDLGALSSWYVWAALGLFPVTPGAANLALASPLFPSVTITLPGGRRLVEPAPGAAASRPYVHALTVSGVTRPTSGSPVRRGPRTQQPGRAWDMPWLPGLGPQHRWDPALHPLGHARPHLGLSPGRRPPSFGSGQLPAVGFSQPSGATTVKAGQPTTISIGVTPAGDQGDHGPLAGRGESGGLAVTPSSGTSR